MNSFKMIKITNSLIELSLYNPLLIRKANSNSMIMNELLISLVNYVILIVSKFNEEKKANN